jgi:S-adenosylmethionine synthetase
MPGFMLSSIQVETFSTGKISDEEITVLLEKHFDFRLAGIIKQFNYGSAMGSNG